MKKLTQKQKGQLKAKIKNGFKKSLHIIGYLSIVAWALLGLLYACGSKKAQKVDSETAQVKRDIQPKYKNNIYASYYYDINDFQVEQTYDSVEGSWQYTSSKYSIYRDTRYYKEKQGNMTAQYYYNLPGSAVMFETFDNKVSGSEYSTYFMLYVTRGGNKPHAYFAFYTLERVNDNEIDLKAWLINGPIGAEGTTYTSVNCVYWYRYRPYAYCYNDYQRSFADYLFKGGTSDIFYVDNSMASSFPGTISDNHNIIKSDYYVKRFYYLFSDYSINDLQVNDIKTFDYFRVADITGDFVPYDKYILGYNGGAYTSNIYVQTIYTGDFYLNGAYYNNINLTYEKVQNVSSFRYGYDSNDFVVVIGTKTLDSEAYSDYFYLSAMSLANTFDNSFINIAYYQHNQGNLNNVGFYYTPEKNYDISDIFNIKSISPTYHNTSYVSFNTPSYYYLGSYFVLYQDTKYHYAQDGSINSTITSDSEGSLYDVMTIINIGFTGLTGLMGYMILPGISIGLLVSIPLTLTLLLFVIKMFKR